MIVGGVTVSILAIALLGVLVGLAAGMFGVGGGFLLTPLLSVLFDIPMPIAVGTGLCQMIGTALATLLRHGKLGQGEPRFDLLMLGGAVVGALTGSKTVRHLDELGTISLQGESVPIVTLCLYGAYALLLATCSWMFWRQPAASADTIRPGVLSRFRLGPTVDFPRAGLHNVSILGVSYLGMFIGFLSGLMGIGGGVALMPILIYGYGFPIKQAAGTGVLALVVTVIAGTIDHARAGHVHLPLACVLLVGSTVSAQFGATLTRRLPAETLRRAFAILLWLAIAAIAWDSLRPLW